jgi:hypothetical protein
MTTQKPTDKVPEEDRQRFMQMAVDLSEEALDAGKGGPFYDRFTSANMILVFR